MASEIPSTDAVLHLAALHTLAATGFASTSRAASLTLSSTLAQYLRVVALACTDRAAQAGRSKVAAIDVVQALDDLGVGGVSELHEWTVGLDQEVTFRDAGLAGLGEAVRKGVGLPGALAEMKLVPDDEVPEADSEDEDVVKEDDLMDMDFFQRKLRSPSDLSWLPPLPGAEEIHAPTTMDHTHAHPSIPSSDLSISERYRKRIPYASSTLSTSREFVDPASDYAPRDLTQPPSSFPALLSAYESSSREPSIAFRQTHYRQQASELLRRFVAPPEAFSPSDTLSSHLPPPRVTPIVPSHSDSIPPHPVPINPDPHSGLLSSLVHRMQSPHLPPSLRERLTSIRPPVPLKRDDKPILYGEPVRGPSEVALARAKGKQPEHPEDEGFLRATWDSGPKGAEKWGKGRLATGKKVVQSGEGEAKPREPPGRRLLEPKLESPAETPGTSKIRLRLSTGGEGSVSPALKDGPSPGPLGPSGIKLNFGRRPSGDAGFGTPLDPPNQPPSQDQRTMEASQRLAQASDMNGTNGDVSSSMLEPSAIGAQGPGTGVVNGAEVTAGVNGISGDGSSFDRPDEASSLGLKQGALGETSGVVSKDYATFNGNRGAGSDTPPVKVEVNADYNGQGDGDVKMEP